MNRNKLLAYPNLLQSTYAYSYFIGKPLNLVQALHYTGVDPQTGQYTYQDRNHDGMISTALGPTGDLYQIPRDPKYWGAMGSELRCGQWQLGLFFLFKRQIGKNAYASLTTPGGISNEPAAVLNRWQKPGDKAEFARFTEVAAASDNYFGTSDVAYSDASFIRLQNLSLSYTLPEQWTRKASINVCRLYIQGQNLIVITGYKGVDPETQNFGGMPVPKTLTAGLQMNF